jgi:predicted HicB family RNase H-like nuclease
MREDRATERYEHFLRVAVPRALHEAVTAAARDRLQSVNSFVRGSLVETLRKDENESDARRRV